MNNLPDGTAVALGDTDDIGELVACLDELRKGRSSAEFVLGVGSCNSPSARVVGFAAKVSRLIEATKCAIRIPDFRIRVFSSATKTAPDDGEPNFVADHSIPALLALVASLRSMGVTKPIDVDLARATNEVPALFGPTCAIEDSITKWLIRAAENNGLGIDPIIYAREHAAPSMFGDLGPVPIIWAGPRPEAKFWQVRRLVRFHARRNGQYVAPSLGLIPTSARRPWYSPAKMDPAFAMLATEGAVRVGELLMAASNPAIGGNAGLKSEARSARHKLSDPRLEAAADAIASGNLNNQLNLLSTAANVGDGVLQSLNDGVTK